MTLEIPTALKRLVRYVMRGFYSIEQTLIVDLMIRKLTIKEEDIENLMKFEKKQLRAIMAGLKNDKLIKSKLRLETGPDGKAIRQTYYFINYRGFVNVVKYKLDFMRRKIETEERDSTKRSSFVCVNCKKTFTDLEADQLYEPVSNEFKCSYCGEVVEEDPDVLPKADSRLMLAKFNEQMEPLYLLLKEVEDIKIPSDLLEPDLVEVNGSTIKVTSDGFDGMDKWRTKDKSQFDAVMIRETSIKVEKDGENIEETVKKEQPPWLADTSISVLPSMSDITISKQSNDLIKETSTKVNDNGNGYSKEVLEALLVHEKLENSNDATMSILTSTNNTNDWGTDGLHDDDDHHHNHLSDNNLLDNVKDELMGEDEDEEEEDLENTCEPMIRIGGTLIPLNQVNDNTIHSMNQMERDEYIKLTQEVYGHLYD
ncbi:general transcription factor IIE subunit 1-like [Panonychus citri]|uniref:general transcription factor IIE subunit 1-like n=1 Tax=Panonychus citri TaxID=50023 RepID=UPI002307507B|nr:general transcription factor IIE subunit 1-like [Panonychus citri]